MKKIYLVLAILFLTSTAKSQWVQKGTDIDGESANDFPGGSVSMSSDGSTLAIGSPNNDGTGTNAGHVRIYEWNNSAWKQKGNDIDGESAQDQSGESIYLSANGNSLAIGAPYNDGTGTDAGHVRVYEWSNSKWSQKGTDIDWEATEDESGNSVSMSPDGNTLAIGAPRNSNGREGHVRIYKWSGTAWIQKGADIDGEADGDNSGSSLSISSDGNILAIGAIGNDGNGTFSGHVRVYEWINLVWKQKGTDLDGEAAGDKSGGSISISSDGNTLAIGAINNVGLGAAGGHVRIYSWNGTAWTQKGKDIDGEAASDNSGNSISMSSDGNALAIGARSNDGTGSNAGHVRVYKWNNTAWVQLGVDIDGEAAGDRSGIAISLNSAGNTLAIGANLNNGNGTFSGHLRVFSLTGTNLIESNFTDNILCYPNPTKGNFAIDLGELYQDAILTITDMSGKVVQSKTVQDKKLLNIAIEEPAGLYFVLIESLDKKAVIKLVKE